MRGVIERIAFLITVGFVGACSSMPLKAIKKTEPQSLNLSVVAGNLNVESFKTFSKVEVFSKADAAAKPRLHESRLEKANFNLNRKVVHVDAKGQVQNQYWVSDLNGAVDLPSMGFPPKGKILMEVLNSQAQVVAVKDVPENTIFYMPKISLPGKQVQKGDSWEFKKRWISLKTSWPFEIHITSTLKEWLDCGGLTCAHIVYKGQVHMPKDHPVKDGKLTSQIKGEFVYAPIGHQFIWTHSNSQEEYVSNKKQVKVHSCSASYQANPDRKSQVFKKKFNTKCS